MYARLEFNPCLGNEMRVALYRQKKDAEDPNLALIILPLTNAQLTELLVLAKIKPWNLDC